MTERLSAGLSKDKIICKLPHHIAGETNTTILIYLKKKFFFFLLNNVEINQSTKSLSGIILNKITRKIKFIKIEREEKEKNGSTDNLTQAIFTSNVICIPNSTNRQLALC